jgi:hypothetical protein
LRRESPERRGVALNRESHLPEMVQTLGSGRRFPNAVNGRQQQAGQNADNGDYDQQFNQRETKSLP